MVFIGFNHFLGERDRALLSKLDGIQKWERRRYLEK